LSDFLNAIRYLIATGAVRISEHGYDELADDGLTVNELLNGIDKAQIVEEYPDYPKGRCILLLQKDKHGNPPDFRSTIGAGCSCIVGNSQRV